MEKKFYVYAYYLESTGEIFHIGKGTGNRFKDKHTHRNQYFLNVIEKYQDDVKVKILQDNLTEEEAWELERELIEQYKAIGQCKTNLHEGGRGGNTGKYNDPIRSQKLSEFAKTRTGEKNSNYGNHWTEEQRAKASAKTSKWWEEHPEFRKTMSEIHKGKIPWNKDATMETDSRIKSSWNKGLKMAESSYQKMMDKDCPYLYQVFLDGKLIFENISSKKLEAFCSKELGISRTIINKVINQTWKPKFDRHKHLETLQILKLNRKCIDQE